MDGLLKIESLGEHSERTASEGGPYGSKACKSKAPASEGGRYTRWIRYGEVVEKDNVRANRVRIVARVVGK